MSEPVFDAPGVRAIDRNAIETQGIPGFVLMRRAAQAAFDVARSRWPDIRQCSVLVGRGNNGGDGLLLGALARAQDWRVQVFADLEAWPPSGADALKALRLFEGSGGCVEPIEEVRFDEHQLVVDALFGTGLSRPPSLKIRSILGALNASDLPVLALDIPSGLDATTGQVLEAAVQADATVTFIAQKSGLFTGAGRHYCADVMLAPLGIDLATVETPAPVAIRVASGDLINFLPRRARDAHKGKHGHVAIIGGDVGYIGAIRMAAEGAARSGAGLVSVGTRAEHAWTISTARPEVMAHPLENPQDLQTLIDRATVVAIGPGLGMNPWGRAQFEAATALAQPLVVDADGLNWLARLGGYCENWVLTPHPGEAARLLNTSVTDIELDRYAAATSIAKRFGGVCVLKGAGTVVAQGEQRWVVDAGNPGMAAGGSGDVLTGVVAGLLAQGLNLADSAVAGALVHAHAGDLAAAAGERGMLASDLIDQLRRAVNPC